MPKTQAAALDAARQSVSGPKNIEAFLAKAGARDRVNIERHLAACDAEADPKHGTLWRRLACTLGTLAPQSIQTGGQHSVQFFVADGKYRMQAFALEDPLDGTVFLYAPDVIGDAVKSSLLTERNGSADGPRVYAVRGSKGETIVLDALTASNTPNPPPHVKHMLGWNRKAIRITLPHNATEAQIAAAEKLCTLAARRWVSAAPA